MTIGLDLSSLQGPHRMRGVGYTLINFINNIPNDYKTRHKFIFYYYLDEGQFDPTELLNLEGVTFEVRPLYPLTSITLALPGKLNLIIRALNKISSFTKVYLGDQRIHDTSGVDFFLQTDQMVSLPKGRKLTKAFIAYDLIPYVLESDYLWTYSTARGKNVTRRGAFLCSVRRWQYIHKVRVNSRRAKVIYAISEATSKDFSTYVPSSRGKIQTARLGINIPEKVVKVAAPSMHRYKKSSWGYIKHPYDMNPDIPYLLYVGGADPRRRIDDLVCAFNQLRGRGYNLKLVLAGDTMQGPYNIPTISIQQALAQSSYIDDIIFMGFVDDKQRDWLYKNALAFVFPSIYEGFGLPVLEALAYNCPVISYPNAAIREVAQQVVEYAEEPIGLMQEIEKLLSSESGQKAAKGALDVKVANSHTWRKMAEGLLLSIEKQAEN